MLITPLVQHAVMTLPAMTDFFSDALDVQSLDVTPYHQNGNGDSVLTFHQPHGLPVGEHTGVCITEMAVPNTIIAIERLQDDPEFFKITLEYEHDFVETPNLKAVLAGFADPNFNGILDIFGVSENPKEFHIELPETTPVPKLTGAEILLEQLDGELTGWHKVKAISETELSFKTPAGVTRAYSVIAPKVVMNIRVWGELTYAKIHDDWQRAATDGLSEAAGLFIVPHAQTRMSRSRNSNTDAITEINSGQDARLTLLDGFDVFACFPLKNIKRIEIADLCHSFLLKALFKTFFGLKLPRPEFSACESEHKMIAFSDHQAVADNDAFYIHKYSFQQPTMIRNADVIEADQYPDFSQGGDSLMRHGTWALRDFKFDLTSTTQGAVPILKEKS